MSQTVAKTVSMQFPDGSKREYDAAMTGAELAESISKSLAKKAVAYAVDGTVRDLSDPLQGSGCDRNPDAGRSARAGVDPA